MMIDQRRKDDCLTACVCSVLGIEYSDGLRVSLETSENGQWVKRLEDFAKAFDYDTVFDCYDPEKLCIAEGKSPRGNPRGHAVVWDNGLKHDPNPDRRGIVGEPEDYIWFVKKGDSDE